MFSVIVALLIIVFFVFIFSIPSTNVDNSTGNLNINNQSNVSFPNPETGNPKLIIELIDIYDGDAVKQMYNQLKSMNYIIPEKIDKIFLMKIKNGYINKMELFRSNILEDYQIKNENLQLYKQQYFAEIKGLHIKSYKNNLEECMIFEKLSLEKEPLNKIDKNAIKIMNLNLLIGYIPANETKEVSKIIKNEHKVFLFSVLDLDGYIDASVIIYY